MTDAGTWLDGFDAGRAVGDSEGFARGHCMGFDVGAEAGRAAERAESAEADRVYFGAAYRGLVRTISSSPSYAELCDRRSDPVRAEAARSLLVERGVIGGAR
ncbi:hypothetical protein BH11ACT1_BH11ACT1_18150 [soil metagenome]